MPEFEVKECMQHTWSVGGEVLVKQTATGKYDVPSNYGCNRTKLKQLHAALTAVLTKPEPGTIDEAQQRDNCLDNSQD